MSNQIKVTDQHLNVIQTVLLVDNPELTKDDLWNVFSEPKAILNDKYLTINETKDFLSVSRSTVLRWIANGDIKSFKKGKIVRVQQSEIDRFRDDNMDNAA